MRNTVNEPDLATAPAKITVALIAKAADDLEHLKDQTGMSKTDLVNRAISLYRFVQTETDNGSEIVLQRPGGASHIIKLL